MVTISELGRKAWRKWRLDGVSDSGANMPTTDDIFPFVEAVDKAITDLSAGYDVSYELRSQLFADLNWANGKTARVFGDPNTAYISVYKKKWRRRNRVVDAHRPAPRRRHHRTSVPTGNPGNGGAH